MSRLTICTACEMGDHSRHSYVVQAVSEGTLGGSVCTCEGECADGRYESKELRRIAKTITRAMSRREGRP